MKAGIYISEQDKKIGGGYTYEENILKAVLKAKTDHELYVFSYGDIDIEKDSNARFIKLKKRLVNIIPIKRSKIKRFIQKKILRKKVPDTIEQVIQEEYNLEQATIEHNIEIIWFPALYSEEVKIPFIMTVWDLQHRLQPYFPELDQGWTWENREKFYSKFIPKASYIVTGNNTAREQIAGFYNFPRQRIKDIALPTPNFVLEENMEKTNILEKSAIQGKYLFYPAQFWPHKNHIRLLQALKILNTEKGENFSLVFTGSDRGNMNYIKQKAVELGINEKVHFLGFIGQEEVADLYKNAFALAFPSYFGPDNIPPLEAMALKCPVICTNVDGMEEQLGDNALFFNPDNANEIVEKVLLLQNSPDLREKLVNSGYKKALSWTSADYFRSILDIVDEFRLKRETWSSTGKYSG